jgi:hypothetical protein
VPFSGGNGPTWPARVQAERAFDPPEEGTTVPSAPGARPADGDRALVRREYENNEPGAAVLLAISKEFQKSVDWLLTVQAEK